jgi:DNA modification methylase
MNSVTEDIRAMVTLRRGDCLELLKEMDDDSVDLVFTSPPYESARSYGIDFNLKGQEWVDWAFERYVECVRVSRGLVAWVVEGRTRDFRYSATPLLLGADLHRAGIRLRKPPAFVRHGIMGGGGPDWFRNDYELVLCSSKGRLPWSDNTACGSPPKYKPGGNPSHRSRDGRVNRPRPQREGDAKRVRTYKPPKIANPGNVIRCAVGGNNMGSKLAHQNEAPFPEQLAERFVLSCCPPVGTVLDPFVGSGTTAAVAVRNERNVVGFDIRQSQIELSWQRLMEVPSEVTS